MLESLSPYTQEEKKRQKTEAGDCNKMQVSNTINGYYMNRKFTVFARMHDFPSLKFGGVSLHFVYGNV